MRGRIIRVGNDVYSDIEAIRKKLIEKGGLHKDLSIRETMEIIWNMKGQDNIGIEEAIKQIRDNDIKIAWGSHGRGTKKYRRGELNIEIANSDGVTKVY